jgi:nesprin-1
LLDPDDLDIPKPDEKSVMTYVAQFLHKYPEPNKASFSGENQIQQIQNILQWMRDQIIKYDGKNGNHAFDIGLYLQAVDEFNSKCNKYQDIKKSLKIPDSLNVEYVDSKKRLTALLDEWKKFIDYNMPNELKPIGIWLYQAEKILDDNDLPAQMNEETAAYISKKIEYHKKFFAAYPDIVDKFNKIRNNQHNIPANCMDYIEKRLIDVERMAKQRRIKLKFMEHKCCLIAFLNLLESKISSVRYGNESVVRNSLEQIKTFLTRNNIYEEFEKALVDMRQVIEEYKIDGDLTQHQLYEIESFMIDTENRWKSVLTGLKCTETMLEETLNNWNRYNVTSKNLDSWMDAAENALGFPEMERLEFFQDICVLKKNFDSLNDAYNFLKATCDAETVNALDHDFGLICRRWDHIYQHSKQYAHAGDILKNRQIYENGVKKLCDWLRNVENLLNLQNFSSSDEMKKYQEDLKKVCSELEDMEDTFRNISKSFQTLIPELSRDEVDRIMKLLKKEKELLVCIRAQVPIKIQLFHQLLSQQESIEIGQQEISNWLDEAENLLSTYSLATRKSQTISQLEKHKNFFARTLYYKSMLESKNIVLQNLLHASDIEKSMNSDDAQDKMNTLNERFNYVVSNAIQWERKLHEIVSCWNMFESCEKQLAEYLKKANHWLTQPLPDNQEELEHQMLFFENLNDAHVKNFIMAANELSKYLPAPGRQDITEIVEKLELKWNNLIIIVPLHILKIKFYMENNNFIHFIREIEKEVCYEEQAFHRNENLDALLSQHKAFFQQSPLLRGAESSLSVMHDLLNHHNSEISNNNDLNNVYQNKLILWQNLTKRIDAIYNDLQQIPDQWKNYHKKFAQIDNWMNNVEELLSKLTRELASLEEFEREKATFQVCFLARTS